MSHNSILGDVPPTDFSPPDPEGEKKKKKKRIKHVFDTFDEEKDQLEDWKEDLKVLSKNEKIGIENLCKFIRRDKVLIHVDLSYAGLSEI